MGHAPSAAVTIAIELPEAKLGVVEAVGVRVAPSAELAAEMDVVCERLRRELTIERVADLESIRGVRAMFRAWGVDPLRYRPSAEALLRRVVQGKGLYRVSSVVDINNLGSIETGWPYGSYDRAKLEPPVTFRLGVAGEKYEGIGKQTWHVDHRPVLADRQGPFGSQISDSVRTMITEQTTAVLAVIFAPAGSSLSALEQAIERLAQRLEGFAGARVGRTAVVTP
jgi:DNA/RNA-binding domain of Phe-tRNA-synthetase-like protein